MAVPPADFQLHNSLFLIAHSQRHHRRLLFGDGGLQLFPKAFTRLHERMGQGIVLVLADSRVHAALRARPDGHDPAHAALRRPSWQPWLLVAATGAVVILAGIVCQVIQLVVSIRARERLRVSGDPWDGRTLEWSTASPPPAWNLSVLPQFAEADTFWATKQRAGTNLNRPAHLRRYKPIEMPKNSPIGFINAFFAVVTVLR
jgi:cytochrome o ubiquinol oxidase subunit 1